MEGEGGGRGTVPRVGQAARERAHSAFNCPIMIAITAADHMSLSSAKGGRPRGLGQSAEEFFFSLLN